MAKVQVAENAKSIYRPPHAQASVSDEWRAGLLSQMTFGWLFPLIKLGKKRPLTELDIGENSKRDQVEKYLSKFEENVRNGTPDTIRRTIWKSFSHHEYSAVACKLVSDVCSYGPPICISYIISYATEPDKWGDTIFIPAGIMLVAPLITGLCNHWFYQFVMIDGLHARTTIQAAVYAKVLRISNVARTRSTKDGGVADTIVNLQSTDCRAIESVYWMWMYIWAAPLQVIVTTVLLYLQLGWAIFVGIGVLVLMIPLQGFVMKSLKKLNMAASKSSDQRIKLITEILHGVQVVKLQAWEEMFATRVQAARAEELKKRRSIAFLQGANTAITESANVLCTLVTFIVYGLFSDEPLTAGMAFTTLALFNILRTPIMVLPFLISMVAGGTVAANRLAKFLYSDDEKKYVQISGAVGKLGTSVEVKNAVFVWAEAEGTAAADSGDTKEDQKQESVPFKLRVADFSLRPGSLTVVTGKVGSGKSSFLSALLGEMCLDNPDGTVKLSGSVAYCAQEPWIQNATLKENILFGQPYDEQRYQEVIAACALEEDILALPGGDGTEIGERGINLSGGQKARVSLGRACYSNSDIVILDDILSAVDAHVARTITDKCLLALLQSRGKTVLIATHQRLCFPDSDHLIILSDGAIEFAGTFQDAERLPKYADVVGASSAQAMDNSGSAASVAGADEGKGAEAGDTTGAVVLVEKTDAVKEKDGKLMTEEVKSKGAVAFGVYRAYMQMCGVVMCTFIIFLAIALNLQQIITNWWLSRWSVASEELEQGKLIKLSTNGTTTESITKETVDTMYYLWIYFALGLGACVLILLYQLISAYGGLKAAARIHSRMFRALLGAPLSFFDTTPTGQLLNLFTADIKAIDETLIQQLSGSLSLLFMMLAVLGTVVGVLPWVILPLVPLFTFYGWVQYIYRNTARELKRFDSKTQSPVFNHFAESLNGLSSIRAYRCEDRMLQETTRRVDYNSRFWTKNNFVNRWLGLRLDWIGAFLVGSTALSIVLAIRMGVTIDPGLVGLVLSYTATLTGLLNWGVRRFSEAELGMVSVERTRRLFTVTQESTSDALAVIPPTWPQNGEVRLTQVTMRYRPGLPAVLNEVSFHIPKHTKVGVCGRTGSGKTTLAKCLFRLMEVEAGKIEIDGVDIARVPLPVLRARITMIPQDPTLFAGALRYSLDPSGTVSSEKLWAALESVDMKPHIENMEGGLDAEIAEGGENLSAGQRQLLCMARALLETPRLLIMDEATSNIDNKTDDKIQSMLKDAFSECSVLTIAHRIDTITWYDRVLVLDQGRVLEYDSPGVLAKTAGSEFSALLDEYRKGKNERK